MKLIFIFTLFLYFAPKKLLADSELINLTTGQSRAVRLPDSAQILVSRKGIVSLTHDHDDFWFISALRSGVVKVNSILHNGGTRSLLIKVLPRLQASSRRPLPLAPAEEEHKKQCQDQGKETFITRATIEMADNATKLDLGFDHSAKLNLNTNQLGMFLDVKSRAQSNAHQRQIIANPVVLSGACEDVILRTGGEDEVSTITEQGRTLTSWKSHGLDLKFKIIPLDKTTLRVPFMTTLRTPSKGQGGYGVTDVQSVLNLSLDQEILAAVINLSSAMNFQNSHPWISQAPIIGPLFVHRDRAKANTTLLVWFKINQKSAVVDTP